MREVSNPGGEEQGKDIFDDGSIIPIISSTDQIANIDTMCVYVQHKEKEAIMNLTSVQQIGYDVYESKPSLYCDSCQRNLFSDEQCYSYDYVEGKVKTSDLCFNCVSNLLAKLWQANKNRFIIIMIWQK